MEIGSRDKQHRVMERLDAGLARGAWPTSVSGWISSLMRPPAPAVVLSGGAALGAFEAGVIDCLARKGLRPSLLVGTSIGALNAAYWAFNPGPDAGAALAETWRSAKARGIFPRRPLHMLRQILQDGALGDPEPLRSALRSIFGDERLIEEANVRLAIVATDLVTGQPVAMRSGPLIPALMASAAIPGYYPPVRIDGRLLVDGGVVANADLDAVLEAHIRDAILIELQAPAAGEELRGTRSILEQTVTISLARQTELERRLLKRRIRLVIVRLSPPHRPHPWDFSRTEELFAMGREAGERLLVSHMVDGRVRPGVVEEDRLSTAPGQMVTGSVER